ncbi:MAG TPA: GntR family transcriptional regulator [Firmicutes bacterium]|nr:GntR family transcriptional regulator [Bacillota bacterium]
MIDFNGTKPIYQEIVSFYEDLIDRGALKAGELMPSVREVAIEEKINPNTVEKAFTILVKEGYLKNIPKKGFFVLERSHPISKEKRLKTAVSALLSEGYKAEEIREALSELEERNDRDS